MANNYILALKEFNKTKPKWCVPKKGTADYQKVMKIKAKLDNQKGQGHQLYGSGGKSSKVSPFTGPEYDEMGRLRSQIPIDRQREHLRQYMLFPPSAEEVERRNKEKIKEQKIKEKREAKKRKMKIINDILEMRGNRGERNDDLIKGQLVRLTDDEIKQTYDFEMEKINQRGNGLLMDLGKQLMSRFGDMKELLKIGKYYTKGLINQKGKGSRREQHDPLSFKSDLLARQEILSEVFRLKNEIQQRLNEIRLLIRRGRNTELSEKDQRQLEGARRARVIFRDMKEHVNQMINELNGNEVLNNRSEYPEEFEELRELVNQEIDGIENDVNNTLAQIDTELGLEDD